MINKLYAIKDLKVGFRNVIEIVNDDIAKRTLHLSMQQDKNSEISLVPQDFELWCLGSYNHDTGEIIYNLEFICNLKEIAPKEGDN